MRGRNFLSEFMQENYLAIVSQPRDLDATFRQGNVIIEELIEELDRISMERIFLTGCGDSLFVSEIGKFAFEEFVGIPVEAVPALELARYRKLDRDCVVIGSSASGHTSRTIEAVRKAKSKGAHIIGVTNEISGILAQLSDWILLSRCSSPLGKSPSKTSTTALLLIFMLAVRLGERRHKIGKGKNEQLMNQLKNLPNIVEKVIKNNEIRIIETTKALKDRENFHFIGGGPSLGVANLGAAKIKELSLGLAEAVELEEFCHYQILVVDKDEPVVLVLPPGASYDRGLEVLEGLNKVGARILAVSDDDKSMKKNTFVTFEIKGDLKEVFLSIPYVVPLQLLAYHLSVQKGRNPTWFREPHASAIRIGE